MSQKDALEQSYSPETDELTDEETATALSCREQSCKFTSG